MSSIPTDELILVNSDAIPTSTTSIFNPCYLFPCQIRSNAFTTLPSSIFPLHRRIRHVPLSDAALTVTRITAGTSREVVGSPGDSRVPAWEAVYPKGSINPGNTSAPRGGFGFYVGGPNFDGADAAPTLCFEYAKEVLFSYAVYFEPGFEFK